MKKLLSVLLVFILLLTSCGGSGNSGNERLIENQDYIDLSSSYDGVGFEYNEYLWYMNDLKDVPLPDPYVFVENDTYYIVGTSDRNINVVDCYVTTDFVTYTPFYGIFNPSLYDGWESDQPEVYAPEIYCFDGVYYMYYSAMDSVGKGTRRCSVVSADNPLGPYEPIVNEQVDGLSEPLFHNDEACPNRCLDISVFTDDDGRMYMYFVTRDATQHVVGVELINPYQADWSTYKSLVVPGTVDSESEEQLLEWELYREGTLKIAEAPFMIKSQGKYYLTYSVNGCWNKYYNVCYAVSDSPLGNFVKPYTEGELWTNMFMGYPGTNDSESVIFNQWAGFASGTGHHCFFYAGEELMIGYHAHANRDWDSKDFTERYFAFDYVCFDDAGVPFANGPTYSIINLPEAISGAKNISKGATVKGTNVTNPQLANDNYIVDSYNLDSKNNEVVLGAGESYIELEFDKEYEIMGIIVYNSAYFDSYILEIEYIDFGNGNIIYYPQFCEDFYVNSDKEFIYPLSCFNLEIINSFSATGVTVKFNLPEGGNINEIVILGK